MARINLFTNNSCPNSRAFNFPILASLHLIKAAGHSFDFQWNLSEKISNCDIVFINSNIFRSFWANRKSDIFRFLEKIRKEGKPIFWFDTTDSTWCTQFEVMPFVSKFLKGQLLVDRNLYAKGFRTGRIYTDFFDALYSSGEKTEIYPIAKHDDLSRLELSWNTCFENYTERRYSFSGKLRNTFRPFLAKFAKEKISVCWTDPRAERRIPVSCRVGTAHSRPSVADHRRHIIKLLSKRGVNCEKIPLPEYFSELRNSQIAVSPFGVGEITLRDFEIIIAGALLLKPDMSHLETWPNLFISEGDKATYLSHRWDMADFEEKLDKLLAERDMRVIISENAQKIYKKHLSEEGLVIFAERLCRIIEK